MLADVASVDIRGDRPRILPGGRVCSSYGSGEMFCPHGCRVSAAFRDGPDKRKRPRSWRLVRLLCLSAPKRESWITHGLFFGLIQTDVPPCRLCQLWI